MSKKHTILYVDDETINLMLFESMFNDKYNVFTAESGAQGLELLKDNYVDMVFSDMKMPEMNGLEFICYAKEQFPNIVYFILSGFDITDEIQEALNNKLVNKYFQKPFDMQEIEACITEML
ncbi:MAG: response regulator [Salinivirgaceae bacterium]|nr:MAG: response regulator [Salinivirgaceae bacterium]